MLLGALYVGWLRSPPPIPMPSSSISASVADGRTWQLAGGDLGATRSTALDVDLAGVEERWLTDLNAQPSAEPVADRERLYVPLVDGRLVAVSAATGEEAWTIRVPGQLDASPAIADGRLFVAQRNGRLLSIDAASGEQLWAAEGGGWSVHVSPIVDQGRVYVAALRELRIHDAADGRLLWSHELPAEVVERPVLTSTRLVVLTSLEVLVFDRSTGEQTYFYRMVGGSSVASAGSMIVAAGNRRVAAFHEESRRPWWDPIRGVWVQFAIWKMAPEVPPAPRLWTEPIAGRSLLPVALDPGEQALYVADRQGGIAAFDPAGGARLWQRDGAAGTPPLAAPGGVLFGEGDTVRLRDPATGDVHSEYRLRDQSVAFIVPGYDVLHVVTEDGRVIALGSA